MIYKPASVSLVGDYAILDSSVDSRFIDTKNRPTLAQTFMDNSNHGIFTVVVDHLHSKGPVLIAPTLEITLSHDTLWPANHKYVDVTATVVAADNYEPTPVVTLISVTSSEDDNYGGTGSTEDDILIIDDFTFQLRAERSGRNKDGRVYTVTYQVEDDCGNITIGTAIVLVPHSMKIH